MALGESRRTCVGCRARRPPSDLIRLYRNDAGELLVGRTGHGRGAWLCRQSPVECFDAAVSGRSFERALRAGLDRDRFGLLRNDLETLGAVERPNQTNPDGAA